jgi:hypothetical protein
MNKTFKNEAKLKADSDYWDGKRREGQYTYDVPSPLLFQWSRALQATVSQALTYAYFGKFHTSQCGIYKCEGGVNIPGAGEICLQNDYCYWDMGAPPDAPKYGKNARGAAAEKAAQLISKIVLEWDPMEPVVSMFKAASEFIGITPEAFEEGTKESSCGGVFGGNALSSFFRWNPFSEAPVVRDYERWCLVNHGNMTDEQVDQQWADQDLGKALMAKINTKISEANGASWKRAMCCSPRRDQRDGTLGFWINTGTNTQIDGWKTEADIEAFLKSDGVLVEAEITGR